MPTNGTMHTLDDVMALVTNRAPLAKSGQISSYSTCDDGNLQKGVAWPSPRFVTNSVASGQIVILDKMSGLMWTKNANVSSNISLGDSGTKTWANAITYCNDLNYGGYSDWRLPNGPEILSLIDYSRSSPPLQSGHPFINVQVNNYWLSTTSCFDGLRGWYISMSTGTYEAYGVVKTDNNYYVWPVRGGPLCLS